ncbi:tetratricopeptide repeat protein [candidate division WOR-3 bacterium]|nr:tetratricopeptide repeat protein [candidate division WOR-3 bacterium]
MLVFHGGAGTGKSRLRQELVRLVDSRQQAVDRAVVTATLDFDIPAYRQPDAALLALRKAIAETGQVRFPSFDVAYAVLWQKAHPDTPVRNEEGGERREEAGVRNDERWTINDERGLLESGSLLSQLLDESGKLPLIGLIPKISKLIAASLDPSTTRPLEHFLSDWWERRGERELEDLPQMEPAAIVEQLPKLWASDLKEFIANRSSLIASRKAVLFIDSYEKLWGTGDEGPRTRDEGQKTDAWVRELVKHLPEALWVISGRQKLRWEQVEKEWGDVLSQHELGALPEHSARQFLSSCGITDEPIQDAIAKGSQGLPHYLNLAVDTFQEIEQSGQRAGSVQSLFSEAESSDSPEQVFAQFIRHLDQPEIETLEVLSASRYWNYGLFEHLVTEYQTGYPLESYDDLSRFSFVGEGAAPETRTMHDLMREALQEHQAPELRKRVHLFLHDLYAGQLKGLDAKGITEKHRTALTEAFYHGRQAMSAEELWAWFDPAAGVFREAMQARVLLPLCREMAQALETELGPDHPDVASVLWRLASQLFYAGEYDEAVSLLRRALAIAEAGQGPEHPHYLNFLDWLANALKARGRFDEAEVLFRRCVEALEKKPVRDADMLAAALAGLAEVLTIQCKYVEAEELSRQALAISENELGPDHERTADVLRCLSKLLFEQQRFSEAEPVMHRALAIGEKRWVANHPKTITALANLAADLVALGRYAEAEPLLRRVLKLYEETSGPDHDDTAVTRHNLAALLWSMGRSAEAEPLSRRALAAHEKKAGSDHPYTMRMAFGLILALAEMGKHTEAAQMALSLVADKEKKHGPDHPKTATALQAVGYAYSSQGRYAEAKDYLGRALEIRTRALGPEHTETLGSLSRLALTEAEQGNYAEAEPQYRDLLAKQERVLSPEHPDVARAANALAGICSHNGRYEEAEVLFRRALAIREKSFGADHPFVAETLEGLAKVCEQTGRAAEARDLSSRAKSIREKAASASG